MTAINYYPLGTRADSLDWDQPELLLDDPQWTDVPNRTMYRLLGPVEIVRDGQDIAPTAPKIRQLVAMLLLRANRIVNTDTIIRELWPDEPPRSVRTTMQTYVYQLRRMIERTGLATDSDDMLQTRAPGYLLAVDPEQIDVFVFQRLVREGRELMVERRFAEAAEALRKALSLWSGPPLANVNCGSRLSAYVVDLQERRRNAYHLRVQAEMEIGGHRELVGELRSLVTANPLDEELHGQLIRVLDRSGRRSEALAVYRNLRGTLREELGLEPSAELRALHMELLAD